MPFGSISISAQHRLELSKQLAYCPCSVTQYAAQFKERLVEQMVTGFGESRVRPRREDVFRVT
jgi:hypothetical protein